MKDDEKSKNDDVQPASSIPGSQFCLFAETPKGVTIGIVSTSEPSSLTLLATGVEGMAARRARLERAKKRFV